MRTSYGVSCVNIPRRLCSSFLVCCVCFWYWLRFITHILLDILLPTRNRHYFCLFRIHLIFYIISSSVRQSVYFRFAYIFSGKFLNFSGVFMTIHKWICVVVQQTITNKEQRRCESQIYLIFLPHVWAYSPSSGISRKLLVGGTQIWHLYRKKIWPIYLL